MPRMIPLLLIMLLPVAHADDLDNIDVLSQQQFGLLAEDLAGVLALRGMQPAEPYGSIGFDVGIEAGAVEIGNEAIWRTAGTDVSSVPAVRVSATKGLPFGFDVGGFISTAPRVGVRNVGAQLRYALLEGGVLTPAVGLRAAVTRLDGVDQLDYGTRSFDISVSKGFGPVTPYAGYGRVWADADPAAGTGLAGVDVAENRAFAGVRFTFVVLQIALEVDQLADTKGYSAKLAFGF